MNKQDFFEGESVYIISRNDSLHSAPQGKLGIIVAYNPGNRSILNALGDRSVKLYIPPGVRISSGIGVTLGEERLAKAGYVILEPTESLTFFPIDRFMFTRVNPKELSDRFEDNLMTEINSLYELMKESDEGSRARVLISLRTLNDILKANKTFSANPL